VIAEEEWAPRFASRRGLPVFMSHGTEDPLLPYVVADRLRASWEAAGADVEMVRFRGGHEIPEVVLDRLGAFVRRVLG
jgi:phospholipase/carboxylesterase